MSEADERLSPLVKKVDKLISKITSSGQHSSSNLINEVGQVCVELTPSRDQSWRAAKRVLAVGSIENKGYLAMCLVDSIVRHETKHKSPDAHCSFADLFSDHVCRLTRRALSVHATDSELGRMSKMIQGWVLKKRFDSGVTKKLKSLVPDASDALHNGSHRRRQSKRKRRSRDLDDGVSPTVSPSRVGGGAVLHHGLMIDQFLRDDDDDDDDQLRSGGESVRLEEKEDSELVTRPASPLRSPALDARSGKEEKDKGKERPSSPGGGFTKPPEAGDAWTSSPPAGGVEEMRGSARGARNEERDSGGSHRRKESRRGSRRSRSRDRGHRGRSRSIERSSRSGRSRSRDRHHTSDHRRPSRHERSRSPADAAGSSSSRHRSSSHGRRSFGRHADNDVDVELPKMVPQHGGWDVPPVQPPPPPYSAQGFNNPMGGFPLPPPTGGRPTPPGPAFVPPQFPSVMGMPQAVFGAPRQQPLYTIPAATPSPPPPPGPAFGQGMSAPFVPPPIPQPAHPARTKAPAFPWRPAMTQRPQGVNVDVTTATRSGDDDDESSEMDIDSPRVVGEKEEEEVAVVVEKKEGAGVEPVKDGGSPTAAEDADALDSLGEVSNQEGRQGGEEEEEDEFDWD